jgi:hypothetical protein
VAYYSNVGEAARVRGEKMSDYAQALAAKPIEDWRRLWTVVFMHNELRAGYLRLAQWLLAADA